jgi:hypothetical protein
VASLHYDIDDTAAGALRDVARYLLTDGAFGLDAALLAQAAGDPSVAQGFLGALAQVAAPSTDREMLEFVLAPSGCSGASAHWRYEQVRRGHGPYEAKTLVIQSTIDGLSIEEARRVLERAAVASYYAGYDATYVRVRFEGNGKSVGFWDADTESGIVMIDEDVVDLETLEPRWPDWSKRLAELGLDLGAVPESRGA